MGNAFRFGISKKRKDNFKTYTALPTTHIKAFEDSNLFWGSKSNLFGKSHIYCGVSQ